MCLRAAPENIIQHKRNDRNMRKLMLAIAALCVSMTLAAQDKYKTLKDISYVSADDTSAYRRERCKLDMYVPEGRKGFKTIVWFHGGALEGGSKELRPELQNAGIAIVAPNYRLFPRCKCPDYTRDSGCRSMDRKTHSRIWRRPFAGLCRRTLRRRIPHTDACARQELSCRIRS